MTKNEILNSGYEIELAAELKYGEYDVIIADLASLDDDGWQIRQSYLSKAGADDYIQVTDGNGTDGWNIAETCGYPTAKRTAAICKHLEISEEGLTEMMDEINDEEHLNSTDWSMLDALREAAEEESEEEGL